jgi:hypothetical protein
VAAPCRTRRKDQTQGNDAAISGGPSTKTSHTFGSLRKKPQDASRALYRHEGKAQGSAEAVTAGERHAAEDPGARVRVSQPSTPTRRGSVGYPPR